MAVVWPEKVRLEVDREEVTEDELKVEVGRMEGWEVMLPTSQSLEGRVSGGEGRREKREGGSYRPRL